jgi:hypothetical protein
MNHLWVSLKTGGKTKAINHRRTYNVGPPVISWFIHPIKSSYKILISIINHSYGTYKPTSSDFLHGGSTGRRVPHWEFNHPPVPLRSLRSHPGTPTLLAVFTSFGPKNLVVESWPTAMAIMASGFHGFHGFHGLWENKTLRYTIYICRRVTKTISHVPIHKKNNTYLQITKKKHIEIVIYIYIAKKGILKDLRSLKYISYV